MTVRTRIAPSPTGYPHIGTIYQAWLNYAFAKKHQGKFIIRIEDTDQSRFVPDAEEKLYQALDWFGISEDESPRKGGPAGPYKQSQRLEIYQQYVKELVEKGLAYYCFCSKERLEEIRKQMQKQSKPPMYDKHCCQLSKEEIERKLAAHEKYVIRLRVPENQTIVVKDLIRGEVKFDSNGVDDQVLIKSDGFPTYHLAMVVDDHLMEITQAVRGEEWLSSAPKHVILYDYFGWTPPIFIHTPVLRNPDKSKLSKRLGHTHVSWYQKQGFLPEAILNFLSLLGWTHPQEKEIFGKEEFIKLFDLKDLSAVGPVFDETKLCWLNGKYIRNLSDEELFNRLKPYLSIKVSDQALKILVPAIKERLELLGGINDWLKFLAADLKVDVGTVKKQSKQTNEQIKELLVEVKSVLEGLESWQVSSIEVALQSLKVKYQSWKTRDFFMTLRVATTGFAVTPPLFESIAALGKKVVIKRLKELIW